MNRISDLTRRLWAALLALCLVLALKRRPSTSAPSMTFCSWSIPAAWTAGAKTAPSIWTPIWN